jgi:sporulation protein YlmC with PRC-barrel domain
MKTIMLVATATLLATVATASAAEFYVVQDTSSKQCRIVEQKPSGSTVTVVILGGESRVYATRAEAETAMNSERSCATDTAQRPAAGSDVRVLTEVPPNSVTISNYYKQSVYDPQNNKIGEIDDTLVSNDGHITAHVLGVGGFLGIGEKHVLVPFNAVKGATKDNKWTLTMSATKDELKAAPGFKYDRSKMTWVKEAASSTTGSR